MGPLTRPICNRYDGGWSSPQNVCCHFLYTLQMSAIVFLSIGSGILRHYSWFPFLFKPLEILCNHHFLVCLGKCLFHLQFFTWLACWLDSCSSCMSSLRGPNGLRFTLVLRCVLQAWLFNTVLAISHLTESHSVEGDHIGSPLHSVHLSHLLPVFHRGRD